MPMNAVDSLLGFISWTLLLVVVDVAYRVSRVARGVPANSWTRGASVAVPDVVKRIQHAHLNCLENLPLFAPLVVLAVAGGRLQVLEPYAAYVLYGRIAQSCVHIVGVGRRLVLARSTLMLVQWTLFAVMIEKLWI